MEENTLVLAWGSGEDGQLGVGNTEDRDTVCQVKVLRGQSVVSVVAGSRNSLAISHDGGVALYVGVEPEGHAGPSSGNQGREHSSSGEGSPGCQDRSGCHRGMALFGRGRPGPRLCLGYWFSGCLHLWLCFFLFFMCGRSNRWDVNTGGNEYGQCGEEAERKEDNSKVLRRDIPIPQRCAPQLCVRQVAAGGTHSVVLTQNGHVWTWGQPWPPGDIKQISTPVRVQGLENVRLIAVGAFHNLALLEEGEVWAWGNNEYGQLGTGDTQPRSQPVAVEGLSGLILVDIAAGGWHSTSLTTDGEVYAWGRGEHGRLGFGDDKSSKMVPQKVHLLDGEAISQVSCGGTHSVALTTDGRLFSYGRGDHGRLGYGRKVTTGHPMEVPIDIQPPSNKTLEDGCWFAKLVACGGRHSLAIAKWKSKPNS